MPHAALVTMVGNSKKEEPWLWTKGCPSLAPFQFGVGFKGEKPTAAGASESESEQKKRWISRETFPSRFPFLFSLRSVL